MNGRSGLFKFFLFLFLACIILLQVLSMVQADRLYERLNHLIDRWEVDTFAYTQQEQRFLDKRFENVKNHKLGLNEH